VDWTQTAQKIANEEALESEVIAALLNAPPDQLPTIVDAVDSAVRSGYIAITPLDWRPALQRLRSLGTPWPGPTCQQCGSPLGEEDSNNNYGPGICWFCWEG
jgi:hypothetical protein